VTAANAADDRSSSEDLIDALERLRLPVFVIGREGMISWLNVAAKKVVGDKTRRHFSKIVAPDSLSLVRREFTRKVIGTAPWSEYTAHLLRSDGSRTSVEISSVPIIGNGQIVGVFGTARVEEEPAHRVATSAHRLTPRQAEVLRLLERGCSTSQIAGHLGLAYETVRNHIRAVFRRLGVHSRLEAVMVAQREHLL
jgi:PAS domain S-box-containing protein